MIDLLTRPPDSWQVFQPQGYPASIHFYFGVQYAEMHLLGMGMHFGVVNSPNHYVHPESPLRPWRYVVFEVSQYLYWSGLGRSYKQVGAKRLSGWEVQHFDELWRDIMAGKERIAG